MSLAMSFATILVMVLCHFDMSQGIALALLLAMLFAMPLTLSLTLKMDLIYILFHHFWPCH